ncbi:transposase [Streptomyces griseoluteus]|uniref:transposase n=1 Tax=Streptomyces griseoluteus TaxID=29306 RepID=UPI003700AB90
MPRQGARLEPLLPLLPLGIKPGRPQVWTRRQLIDGIRRRTRTGAPWRDVPERYGPVGPGLRPVPAPAAGRYLGKDPHPAPGRPRSTPTGIPQASRSWAAMTNANAGV